MQIVDADGLIEWLATDRCRVTIGAGNKIQARSAALEGIVRQWIGQI